MNTKGLQVYTRVKYGILRSLTPLLPEAGRLLLLLLIHRLLHRCLLVIALLRRRGRERISLVGGSRLLVRGLVAGRVCLAGGRGLLGFIIILGLLPLRLAAVQKGVALPDDKSRFYLIEYRAKIHECPPNRALEAAKRAIQVHVGYYTVNIKGLQVYIRVKYGALRSLTPLPPAAGRLLLLLSGLFLGIELNAQPFIEVARIQRDHIGLRRVLGYDVDRHDEHALPELHHNAHDAIL